MEREAVVVGSQSVDHEIPCCPESLDGGMSKLQEEVFGEQIVSRGHEDGAQAPEAYRSVTSGEKKLNTGGFHEVKDRVPERKDA